MTITLDANFKGAGHWFNDFSAAVLKDIDNAVVATALEVVTDVKKRISRGPKTGKTYGNHQASAAGEAPATDTGVLASSIYFDKGTGPSATVGSRLAYAAYLEFGTAHIKPRPSWTPAVELARPKLTARVEKAILRRGK
jgi:phage gpG-like protein